MNPDNPLPAILIPLILIGFPVFFVLLWTLVCLLISFVGGWRRLARRYRAAESVHGEAHHRISGTIGWASYRGVLTIHISAEGLHLSTMRLFRIGHPPLFVPWSQIHFRGITTLLWAKVIKLEIGDPAIATVRLPAKLFENRQWPAD